MDVALLGPVPKFWGSREHEALGLLQAGEKAVRTRETWHLLPSVTEFYDTVRVTSSGPGQPQVAGKSFGCGIAIFRAVGVVSLNYVDHRCELTDSFNTEVIAPGIQRMGQVCQSTLFVYEIEDGFRWKISGNPVV